MDKYNWKVFQILFSLSSTLCTIAALLAMVAGDYGWGIFLALLAIKTQLRSMESKQK